MTYIVWSIPRKAHLPYTFEAKSPKQAAEAYIKLLRFDEGHVYSKNKRTGDTFIYSVKTRRTIRKVKVE